MKAEIKVMHLQAKKCQRFQKKKTPEAREEGWNRFSTQPSGAMKLADTSILDF